MIWKNILSKLQIKIFIFLKKISMLRDQELKDLFINIETEEHTDALEYLNRDNQPRNNFYTISNIEYILNTIGEKLFNDFIKIMIFDALVGEQDRHEENWGIQRVDGGYRLSPLYDNGCSLLRNFKDETYAKKYYDGTKNFDSYINQSKTLIYKENNNKKYKHFELIKFLYIRYQEIVYREIINLKKLDDKVINEIVNKIPDDLLTNIHKKYIILYLIRRRNILLEIIERGNKDEK